MAKLPSEIYNQIYQKGYQDGINAKPKGKWKCICDTNCWQYTDDHYECSNCHYKGHKSNFCPNCGAKMISESEDN